MRTHLTDCICLPEPSAAEDSSLLGCDAAPSTCTWAKPSY